MIVSGECHIATGFVTMTVDTFFPQEWPAAQLQLFVPKNHNTTITDLFISNMVRDSVYATAVVPLEEVTKQGYNVAGAQSGDPANPGDVGESSDPELFTLLLPNRAEPGDSFKMTLSYFQPLVFESGSYFLRLPTTFQHVCLPPGTSISQLLEVDVSINSGYASIKDVQYHIPSQHPMKKLQTGSGYVKLQVDNKQPLENRDVEISYKVWQNEMTVALNVIAPPKDPSSVRDPRGSFCLSVAPPDPDCTGGFRRSVIFVLDRSGSMSGDPMVYAQHAIITGIKQLSPEDELSVIAFDHEQMYWTDVLVPATPENILNCEYWVSNQVQARGLTDIMTPLQRAIQMLRTARGLPTIFLITDGCVENEREICMYIEQYATPPPNSPIQRGMVRINTFAIGPYCNHYFLKQLSTYGRGMFDVAFRAHSIQVQMERMLMAAAKPVLSDVSVTIPGVTECELVPYPIPDLFCGNPLLVCGKFSGTWPQTITLNGVLPNGQPWTSQPLRASAAGSIPLDKVFMKQRLDLLTARAWLHNNRADLVQPAVDYSVAIGVPCAYTQAVGFETTRDQHQQFTNDTEAAALDKKKKRKKIALYAVGGVAGVAVLAGVGVALVFGSLALTAANASAFEAVGAAGGVADVGGGGDAGGGCCDCDGCDCNGCDCDAACDAMGSCSIS